MLYGRGGWAENHLLPLTKPVAVNTERSVVCVLGITASHAKSDEPNRCHWEGRLMCTQGGKDWRHLVNTTEQSKTRSMLNVATTTAETCYLLHIAHINLAYFYR